MKTFILLKGMIELGEEIANNKKWQRKKDYKMIVINWFFIKPKQKNRNKEPERKTVTSQLLVLCEDPDCKPLGHPLFEIAGFGRAAIVKETPVSIFKLYKLVPYEEHSVNN